MNPGTGEPTVSCVMIFRDADGFIDEAVESVVQQVGGVTWELVLVDDGSTDGSTARAQRWAAADPRMRYLEHPGHANLGMSASRNAGIAAARGKYVAFLDSDDVWLPSMLVQRVRLLESTPGADAVLGPTWEWHSWTGRRRNRLNDQILEVPDRRPGVVISPPTLFLDCYQPPFGWTTPAICSLLFRREAIASIGGFDPAFRSIYEDQVGYVKTFLNLAVVLDERPLSLYRQHNGSACSVAARAGEWKTDRPSPTHSRFLGWMADYVREHSGIDSGAWRVVDANLNPGDVEERVARPPASPARRLYRILRRRAREIVAAIRGGRARRSLPDAWTEQLVAAWSPSIDDPVLVVTEQPRRQLPFIIGGATVRRWARQLGDLTGTFPTIIVMPDATRRVSAGALLAALAPRLEPGGTLVALLPGPASGRRTTSRGELVELARRWFPDHDVTAEPFGSAATLRAIRWRVPAMWTGVDRDRHDPALDAYTGLSITSARRSTAG